MYDKDKIRNVAIIAHIDHGKTTLVDFMLKQSHTFRESSAEMGATLIMDSNTLERERGITILAKNTAVHYKDFKINIIDTPGHADFGGEVERTLAMADGCILLVDAQEGPMPQTRVVLQKALDLGLKPIVVINKIDKPASRVPEVLEEVSNLFLELAIHESQLEYPLLYAVSKNGKSFDVMPEGEVANVEGTLEPLFEKIISYVPPPAGDINAPLQILVTALDYDEYKGVYAIGKIARGTALSGMLITVVLPDGTQKNSRIETLFTWEGLHRSKSDKAVAGDIVAISGIERAMINSTICAPDTPEALPQVAIEEPTLKVTIGANTSPFLGRDGNLLTARQLKERLDRELETNVALRMEVVDEKFLLRGRGELHLSILFETLRREGFEFEVSKPAVVTKEGDGKTLEPYEEVTIDVPEMYRGTIVTELAKRRAEMKDTFLHAADIRFVYEMATRSLLGLRNVLMTATRGSFVLHSHFVHYGPEGTALPRTRSGVLVAHEAGKAVAFGLNIAQGRGATFIDPGVEVYEGMIVGENSRSEDMDINVCKGKELSNMRSKSSDGLTLLAPALKMTLEQALDYIEDDELLEITPKDIRMRKKYLSKTDRARATRNEKN